MSGTWNALRVIGHIPALQPVLRTVDNPTSRGVALIDCWIERGGTPLHWFAETHTKPPLDIKIMACDGRFQGLQFVLQDEVVPTGLLRILRSEGDLVSIQGIPRFDISQWPAGRTYHSTDSRLVCFWTAHDELCIALSEVPIRVARECIVSDSLVFLLGGNDDVVGICLMGFSDLEKAAICRAEPI